MTPQMNIALASGALANIIRNALHRTDAVGQLTLEPKEVMDILSNTGVISSSIAMMQLGERTEVHIDLNGGYNGTSEETRSVVPDIARRDVQVAMAAESGANIPAAEKMARAVAAADELNRMNHTQAPTLQQRMQQEQSHQNEADQMTQESDIITGQTGTVRAATQTVSPANQKRNEEIQRRLREHALNQTTQRPPVITPGAVSNKPQKPQLTRVEQPQAITITPAGSVVARKAAPATPTVTPHVPTIQRTEVPATVVSRTPLGNVGPGARADGYVPAVGTNRDMTTTNRDIQPMNCEIPEEDQIAGRNSKEGYLPIEGLNVSAPSPYQRLTDPEFSEFAMIFASSVFAPDSRGVVNIPHEDFPWNREIELPALQGPDLVSRPQGFYGFNPNNGGPNYVLIRLPRNIVIWNFNHTPGNCRIFYIGRSNVTGRWYTPEALDKLELFTMVGELAQARASLVAKSQGRVYTPVARSLL